ncbi:MAG TPA: lipopolysaccharide biosynthesis protein [Candidatus Binatia bacterium]|nr:lipopolysaccharide biosynthesis protein [Candidatus Binatia bacterium]
MTIVSARDLDRQLVRGIAWTGAMKWFGQIVSWASTIVVARLLEPEDYGVVAMAMLFLGLVTLVNEFGLGAAIVVHRDLSPDQRAQINGFAVLVGVAAYAVCAAAAMPLAMFFGVAELRSVVIVMSIPVAIGALRTVPTARLERDLRFKLLAGIEAMQISLQAFVVFALALAGLGYWALVLGSVAGAVVSTGLTLACRPSGFAWPQPESIRSALALSKHVLVTRVAWYVQSNADFLVAGRVLGQAALGAYTLGWTIAAAPVDKITALVARVTFPVFASVQDDVVALRRYLLMLTEGLAVLTFAAGVGLALVADDFVYVVLGPKWEAAIMPLRLLAILAAHRGTTPLLPQILNVIGESRFGMYSALARMLLLPAAFYAGSGWGVSGIATAWLLIHPVAALPTYSRVFGRIGLAATDYLRSLWPAASSALAMTAAVLVLRLILPPHWTPAPRLALEIFVGGAAYLLAMATLHRRCLHALADVVKLARG